MLTSEVCQPECIFYNLHVDKHGSGVCLSSQHYYDKMENRNWGFTEFHGLSSQACSAAGKDPVSSKVEHED